MYLLLELTHSHSTVAAHSVNYHDMARGNLCASTATASCIIVLCVCAVLGCEVDLKLNTQFAADLFHRRCCRGLCEGS